MTHCPLRKRIELIEAAHQVYRDTRAKLGGPAPYDFEADTQYLRNQHAANLTKCGCPKP
jgi:hypothetical protein